MDNNEKWKLFCEFARTGVSFRENPHEPWDIVTRPVVKTATRRRKPTLVRVKKQAAKAGIEVAAYSIEADGTISVVPASPNETTDNPWDRVQ
jgi:hypothetical protein